MSDVNHALPDGTRIDLVRSLFNTLPPSVVMTIAFVGVAAVALRETPDSLLAILAVAGGIASVVRLGTVLFHAREARRERLDLVRANVLERRFAISYLVFAAVLGMFGARAFVVASAGAHMLVIVLLCGYGAGVASGIALRPKIAVAAMLIGVGPTILVTAAMGNSTYVAAGGLLAIFLVGGFQSLLQRYRNTAADITLRRTFTALARSDDLTGLANRLSLREAFDQLIAQCDRGEMVVVHCLDLDRFKPVNDHYGHPVGDALLRAVSERLNGVLRRGDVAARMGGDEFVILQSGARHEGEAEMLARRIVRAVAQPYLTDGRQISIGTSVGYAFHPEHGANLDSLIARADEALCEVKRKGGGIAAYGEEEPTVLSLRSA